MKLRIPVHSIVRSLPAPVICVLLLVQVATFAQNSPRPFGRRGFGGPREETRLVKQFDADGDKRLNNEERKAARVHLARDRADDSRPGPGARFRDEGSEPSVTVDPIDPRAVSLYPDAPLYDPTVVRTLFFEFENDDWEAELADFYNTDVEVPAKLTVDAKTYPDVGVHFRGASSYFTVGAGQKRSLNVSLDYVHEGQNIGGYRTLNLLNSHRDPTFLRTVLYYEIARDYIPAPKANHVQVVINGQPWGVFVNAQQFNKDFIRDWFSTDKGARWKAPGSPRGRAGLEYLGDDPAAYQRVYEIKSRDDPESWSDLIRLCRVLSETPLNDLVSELEPLLDIEGTLKFLALENVLINSDGYWVRASDYNLYQDESGRFHLIPYDANETFRVPEGPGMNRRQGRGIELDPLAGADDPGKPLLNRLLAVESLKTRYLGYVRAIADKWLSWESLGQKAERYHSLIADHVRNDPRKLDSTEDFMNGLEESGDAPGLGGRGRPMTLKRFVEQRQDYLLNHPEIKNARM
jgi:hypothetical protein